MFEPISTGAAITLLVKSASSWLPAISDALIPPIRDTLLGKGAERTFDKLNEQRRKIFHLDKKEQERHLELVLKNAAERGLAQFQITEEQQQYNEVIKVLSDSYADALRREALRLFTLSDEPDFEKLATLFDQARSQGQSTQGQAIDATSYLSIFFESLVAELYLDPFFRQQMSTSIRDRATISIQRSLTEAANTLRHIDEALEEIYTSEKLEEDIQIYIKYVEESLRYLRLGGVVPKDRTNENRDPELDGIFVPLRIALQNKGILRDQTQNSIVDLLEQIPCLVLLGGPGFGKSTAVSYLAWSHALVNLGTSILISNAPLLSGKPLPLRIELRRLIEARRQKPDYDFLTYTTEVLLKRSGHTIARQMFEVLLEQKRMVVLFDGLDEVATLDDRRTLTSEIESFARRYQGNRFLVTSRPVGYELAPLADQNFSHAQIQLFDDSQIHLFLEHWYTHVLRLSPLSPDDLQELDELYTTLKDNLRLHALAENPLLLTVITALHHYERLPDRRILVYDRCAGLLLETWAKLKGTNKRWNDLKLSTEDQYACVAHLGFILHQRSQEQQKDSIANTTRRIVGGLAADVPARFMLQRIERFLHNQNLFTSKAEQNIQAKRFLELIQEEAGLIVERGTDENGESLYGFVHRTFQEYFAAVDVFERYQQEENSAIISEFLVQHLHDPHWREVILLLLGKLKRKPVTSQLRQILEGKIDSHRSRYTNILRQDLFFISSCLTEEIATENELAESIISHLGNLIKSSPYLSQCLEAVRALGDLMQTRQYATLARQELRKFAVMDSNIDLQLTTNAAITFFQKSIDASEDRQYATEMLLQIAQHPNLPVQQFIQAIQLFYITSNILPGISELVTQLFLQLTQRSDLSIEQSILIAQGLYQASSPQSEERRLATQILLQLAQRSDLSIDQISNAARSLYRSSLFESEERRLITQVLLQLAQRSDLTVQQLTQIIRTFNLLRPSDIKEQVFITQLFLQLTQRSDLSIEQSILIAQGLYQASSPQSEERRLATQILLQLAQRSDLSIEQSALLAQNLFQISSVKSEERQISVHIFLQLTHLSDLPVQEFTQIIRNLYLSFPPESEERQFATQLFLQLTQRSDLSIEQSILIAQGLYQASSPQSEERRLTAQILLQLAQRSDLSIEQSILIAQSLYWYSPANSEERRSATHLLSELAQKHRGTAQKLHYASVFLKKDKARYQDILKAVQMIVTLISYEDARQFIKDHWQKSIAYMPDDISEIPYIVDLVQQKLLPIEARSDMHRILRNMVPQFGELES